jgi:hypothetical protein
VPYWAGGLYVHGAFALLGGMRFFVMGEKETDMTGKNKITWRN